MGWPFNTVHQPMAQRTQEITIATASATSSTAFPTGTEIVRIVANTPVYYDIASSATATESVYLPANTVEYVACNAGNVIYFQAFSTSGRAWVTPCAA